MPTPIKPSLPPVPGPEPVPGPVSVPVSSAPRLQTFEVTCVEADSIEKTVSVQEAEGVHACVRRVYYYKFALDPKPVTQPAVVITVESLTSLPFEVKKNYLLSLQPK